jgi:hypothetical protein
VQLPDRPNLRHLRDQARDLVRSGHGDYRGRDDVGGISNHKSRGDDRSTVDDYSSLRAYRYPESALSLSRLRAQLRLDCRLHLQGCRGLVAPHAHRSNIETREELLERGGITHLGRLRDLKGVL